MVKTGLKVKDVSKDHFSSGSTGNAPKFSRLVVRIVEAKQLLASDVETGKSDPICFVWCGYNDESPNVEQATEHGDGGEQQTRWVATSVCYTTTDPVWNQDIVFPLDISDVMSLSQMRCLVFVRDEDRDEEGNVTYDDLGMLEFPMQDLLIGGRAMQNSIVRASAWYDLKKSPGMRKVDGCVKLTISLIFAPEDTDAINSQLDGVELGNTNNRMLSLAQKLQQAMKVKAGKVDTNSLAQGSRASVRNSSNRPLTAGSMRSDSSTTSILSQSQSKMDASSSRGYKIQGIASPIKRRPNSASTGGALPRHTESEDEGENADDPELIVLPKVASRPSNRYPAAEIPSVVEEADEEDMQSIQQQEGYDLSNMVPAGGDESVLPELLHAGAAMLNDLNVLDAVQDGIVN
eukprot:gene34543-41824_t